MKEKLKLRMASLCARSEQCSADIYTKLCKGGLVAADAKEVLEDLKNQRFVDDARFAAAYARDKVRFSSWGPLKVRAGLTAKRIPSDLIQQAIEAVDANDIHDALMRCARSKARTLNLTDPSDAKKLLQYLAGRGFGYEQCMGALRELRSL